MKINEMGLFRKRSHYTAVLLWLGLTVFFQNCSNPIAVRSRPPPSYSLSSEPTENGDGYMGKPSPGEYFRTHPDFRCGPTEVGQLQAVLSVTDSQSNLMQDNCVDTSYPIDFSDPRLDFVPFNPDFIAFSGSIFEKRHVSAVPIVSTTEVLCRQNTGWEGIDAIIQLNPDGGVSAKVFTGVRDANGWRSRVIAPFSVIRAKTLTDLSYDTSNFQLQILNVSAGTTTFQGRLAATIDSIVVHRDLICRVMNLQPAVPEAMNGLVGLWQMNSDYADSSGNGNRGVPIDSNGTVSFQSGHYQQALDMDGVDDRVEIQPAPGLNNIAQVTVAAWVWPTDMGNFQTRGGIANKADAYEPTSGWSFGIGSSTRNLFINAAFDSGINLYGNTSVSLITPSAWHHLALTWDGTGNLSGAKAYVDGVLTPWAAGNNAPGTRVDDSSNTLKLGDYGDTGPPVNPNSRLKGRLDQVSIWNRVLSPQEIQNLYSKGTPQP